MGSQEGLPQAVEIRLSLLFMGTPESSLPSLPISEDQIGNGEAYRDQGSLGTEVSVFCHAYPVMLSHYNPLEVSPAPIGL